jgi:hypothetical protein
MENAVSYIRRVIDMDADKVQFRIQGIIGTATAGAATNIQWKLPERRYIEGGHVLIKDGAWGDKVQFQIVDVDNVIGYGAGAVLDTFVSDLYVNPEKIDQGEFRCPYIADVYANLYLRLVYTSLGAANVGVALNLFSHIPK